MSVFPPEASPTRVLYSASTAKFTPVASPTDILEMKGSATKIIKIWKIFANTWSVSTPSIGDIHILRRSTAASGGTSTTVTANKFDSNDAAATAVIKNYTANPTTGTLVSQVNIVAIPSQRADSSPVTQPPINNVIFDAAAALAGLQQPLILRGASEYLVLNGNGVSLSNTWAFTVLFSEE